MNPSSTLDRENPMNTHGTYHLSMNDFANKLLLAGPGETFVYATGDLAYSTGDKKIAAELKGVRALAWDAYERGDVILTQLRLPEVPLIDGSTKQYGDSFEYRATKRSIKSLHVVRHKVWAHKF